MSEQIQLVELVKRIVSGYWPGAEIEDVDDDEFLVSFAGPTNRVRVIVADASVESIDALTAGRVERAEGERDAAVGQLRASGMFESVELARTRERLADAVGLLRRLAGRVGAPDEDEAHEAALAFLARIEPSATEETK